MGSPGVSDSKESTCNAGDTSVIPGVERFPREGNGNPLQDSCLENPMDRASGNLHAPWVSELHLLPPAHLRLSHSSFSPLRLQSGCPSPSTLGPTILSDRFCLLPLLSLPETRCPAAPIFKNISFLSGVSLAQSQPQIPGAEASPVSLSPPHHSQSPCQRLYQHLSAA